MTIAPSKDNSTKVVYVDDRLEGADQLENAFSHVEKIDLAQPGWQQRLKSAAIEADLIVMDLDLDRILEKDWLVPIDGRTLSDVIRAIRKDIPQRAVYTIFSGKLNEIPEGEGLAADPHLVARRMGADWVGEKQNSNFILQLRALADGVQVLRTVTADEDRSWKSVFQAGDTVWAVDALDDVERFQPPVEELLGKVPDEPAFLRWVTQVALPYPTFLLDHNELAIRLRLHPKQLSLHDGEPLSESLSPMRYKGILANFTGPRWWRVGVDNWMWELTSGNPYDLQEYRRRISAIQADLPFLTEPDPVLVRDEFGRLLENTPVAEAKKAVRIQPSDWPAIVDWPWALIDEARKDPVLNAMVLPEDRHRLQRGA